MAFIKMAIYGEPGVGKSTFAAKAPKPFFITTDGNYEYLESFCGAKPEDHVQIGSWKEFKNVIDTYDFSEYETIVVDLVEDTYLWAANEFCKENKISHLSDFGYGKGYEILGQDYFITYNKLIAMPYNIILIFHGVSEVLKDRRGVEYTKYKPSNVIREKIVKQIEGRMRFFLRAYAETAESNTGRLKVARFLSLSPDGSTEYGVARGLSEDCPPNVELDWDAFVAITGITLGGEVRAEVTPKAKPKEVATTAVKKPTVAKPIPKKKVAEPAPVEETVEEPKEEAEPYDEVKAKLKDLLASRNATPVEVEEPAKEEVAPVAEPVAEEPKTPPVRVELKTGTVNNEDKLAAIKAKMAALKANK